MQSARWNIVHKSLSVVRTIAGAERGLAIANGTIAAAFIFNGLWQWIFVTLFAHALLVWMAKKDVLMRQIYLRYSVQGDRYDPWPHVAQRRNERPEGCGKGMLC